MLQARLTFVDHARRDGGRVASIHRGAIGRQQSDHVAVPRAHGLAVMGAPDQKQRSRAAGLHPPGPVPIPLAEFQLVTELAHQRRIERHGAREIGNPHVDVRQLDPAAVHAIADQGPVRMP